MGIPFYQVDVFTDHIFGGNPLAVFTEGQKLKEEDLQKIAREMNLSETSFVYPSTKNEADFDVRIFTPTREIPFAGHPTLGSAYVLRKYGAAKENPLRLNFKAGVIPVSTEGDRSFMQHPPAQILHELIPSKIIAEALGIPLSSLDGNLPIKVVTTGFPALFVPVNSLSVINKIAINTQTLNEVLDPLEIDMIYPFCRETLNPDNTVHSRAFAPGLGILEDPATGSVAGAMGAYWASLSNEVDISMVIEQGYAMQRPSLIHVEVSNREIQKIRVGGQCQSVFTGLMDLEGKL
ncbi:MAG: PhzF family phenazine biosynthesis protein [Nitrospinaceae bacterium]|nr:PhzF family phenazine biosynthesis protein [Nitrospinaceae bacterium]